jgi:V-type H+-transporting ATPase subunit d
MELSFFNVQHGFIEAVVRGLRSGLLGTEDYRRISTSDTLEDMRSALEETDYSTFLQDEPSPLLVSTISNLCFKKLADEFEYVKSQTSEPLTTFMDFIAREKMIDNVCMIIQGALNNKSPFEMQEKIHPLGVFDGMKMIMAESFDVQGGFDEVYRVFLVDTPIGPYFEEYLKEAHKDDDTVRGTVDHNQVGALLTKQKQDLEIMKATLKKAWLEDFHSFVMSQGGTTAEVMGHMLKMEADFRVLLVTLNALNTTLSTETRLQDRNALYPNFGYLYPEGTKEIRKAWNETTVRQALEPYAKYLQLFDEVKQFYESQSTEGTKKAVGFQSIEDLIYAENVRMYEMAFEQQFHFGVFYAWMKLKEQEIRNIRWIANMVVLGSKDHIDDTIVKIFEPRM